MYYRSDWQNPKKRRETTKLQDVKIKTLSPKIKAAFASFNCTGFISGKFGTKGLGLVLLYFSN